MILIPVNKFCSTIWASLWVFIFIPITFRAFNELTRFGFYNCITSWACRFFHVIIIFSVAEVSIFFTTIRASLIRIFYYLSTLWTDLFSIFAFSIFTFSIFTFSIFAFSIFTFSIFAFSIFAFHWIAVGARHDIVTNFYEICSAYGAFILNRVRSDLVDRDGDPETVAVTVPSIISLLIPVIANAVNDVLDIIVFLVRQVIGIHLDDASIHRRTGDDAFPAH